jgi:ribosomal protein L7/L12
MAKCSFCDQSVAETAVNCPRCGAAIVPANGSGSPAAGRYPAVRPDDASWHPEIASLVAQGRKIEAIKLYRDRTGAGLAEAKTAIEALGRGESMVIRASRVTQGTSAEADLLDLLRQGQKVQAIKVYRERTGTSLREAKEAVERLAAQQDIVPSGSGCLPMLAFTLVAPGLGCGLVRAFS